jgi:hypothetical protein
MALIKWKQISGQLGNYGNLTGSLDVSGSINLNGQAIGTGKLNETTFNSYTSSLADGTITVASASYAISASVEILTEISSSHAETADSASFIADSFISASGVRAGFSSTTFNGNRIISQQHLPGFFTSSFNPGTSGSISDFLEKVFYPNDAPQFTSNANLNIAEFLTSGSTILTLTANDIQGQALTFAAQDSYTAGFVNVATNGVVTLLTSSIVELFNTTNRGDGTNAHQVPVKVTDTFDAVTNQNLFIDVTANSAPVFRQTSATGTIITAFTASRNENASTGEVTKIYFTDTNSDSITIRSSSVPGGHFTITKSSNYVSIAQATASLDFESTSSYSFSISASDEHYESGQDTDSIVNLPITISVTDNVHPTINNQTLTAINESSSAGTVVDNIAASDSESDTITFFNFALSKLELDNSNVPTGSYGGTSQLSDPSENPFQMNSSGQVTRKNGVHLNSDLINEYQYSVQVRDSFNTASNQATVTIPIDDDTPPTIGGGNNFFIIESAISGAAVYDSSNGFSGTATQFTANESVTFTVNPSSDFVVDSLGNLTINRNISGSSDVGGNSLSGQITASNNFATTTATTFTVNITDNVGPSVNTQAQTANHNTNGARVGNYIYQFVFSDTESDAINKDSLVFNSTTALSASFASDTVLRIFPTASLSAGNYVFSGSIQDDKGFATSIFQDDFDISQAPIGTLGTNGTFRVIESAVNGNNIVTNLNGRTGTQADLSVSYSPTLNSAAVQSFTSSNAAIVVNSSGNLTLGVNLSGSATSSGATISSDITYRDQYDNIGSGSISVTVRPNSAPEASFSYVTNALTCSVDAGTTLANITITDDESDTPFSMSLTGDVSNLKLVAQNTNSSSYQLQNIDALITGSDFNYTASVFDNFDETRIYSQSFNVRDQLGLTYLYGWQNSSPSTSAAFLASAGDAGGDELAIVSGSLIAHFESGSIGSLSFTPSYVGNKVTLKASGSLSNLSGSNGIHSFGFIDLANSSSILMWLFPSQSLLNDKPADLFTGSQAESGDVDDIGEYYLYKDNFTGVDGLLVSSVYYFDTQNFVEGNKRWGMVYVTGAGAASDSRARYNLIADEQQFSS